MVGSGTGGAGSTNVAVAVAVAVNPIEFVAVYVHICTPAMEELNVKPLGLPCKATDPEVLPATPEQLDTTVTALVLFQIGEVPDTVATGLGLLKLAVIVGGGFGSVYVYTTVQFESCWLLLAQEDGVAVGYSMMLSALRTGTATKGAGAVLTVRVLRHTPFCRTIP